MYPAEATGLGASDTSMAASVNTVLFRPIGMPAKMTKTTTGARSSSRVRLPPILLETQPVTSIATAVTRSSR